MGDNDVIVPIGLNNFNLKYNISIGKNSIATSQDPINIIIISVRVGVIMYKDGDDVSLSDCKSEVLFKLTILSGKFTDFGGYLR